MKRLILALLALGWAGIVSGQTPITLAWDPGAPSAPGCVATATAPCYGPATDFAASYGTASGQYTVTQDLGLSCPGTPATATAPADPTACVGTVTLSPGTWFLVVEARDASVPSAYSNEISTTIAPAVIAPSVTVPASPLAAIVGVAFSYQVVAANTPTSYGASGLPAGLSLSSTTGLVTGTPTQPGGGTATATITATNSAGTASGAFPFVVTDPNCAAVTGADAISIFPTAVQQTGSGGPGSRFRLDFTALSPGSPITHLAIQANGANISATDGTADGTNVGSLAGLWGTVPAASGTYHLTILATNTYSCSQTQATPFTITVP